jgi:hypothetical protein
VLTGFGLEPPLIEVVLDRVELRNPPPALEGLEPRARHVALLVAEADAVRPGILNDKARRAAIEAALTAAVGGAGFSLIWPQPGARFDAKLHRAFPEPSGEHPAWVTRLNCCGFATRSGPAPAWVEARDQRAAAFEAAPTAA